MQAQNESTQGNIEIVLNVEGQDIVVALEDSATTRDFLSQLPLTLTFEDHNGTEKISYLPRRLSTEGAPDGYDPQVGTFAYYAPWGNLALYYKDFVYSRSLINLGSITSGLEVLSQSPTFTVTITLAD
ncbi:cyclophilin-like fold protein [Litchfieldella anticariensis]|uniref:cyclophilin-like fold protein n=1 Tax=Litchfieldella anticariensis TaxID=258591 RepID=UPI00191C2EF5|nr:cyclophilin-like fold protein [Halomonas anticariensis]